MEQKKYTVKISFSFSGIEAANPNEAVRTAMLPIPESLKEKIVKTEAVPELPLPATEKEKEIRV